MDKRSLNPIALALILGITLFFTGSGSGNLDSPIYINLSLSKVPLVNESAYLTCNVSSIMDAPNTTATISLPEGVELVKGELNGQWDLKANTPVYLNATIRFLKAGDFQIKAAARRAIDANNFWGDVESLYLTIGPEASSFTLPLRWAGYPSIEVSGEGVQAEKAEGGPISIDPITLPMTQELPVASRGGGPGIYESTSIAAEPPAEEMPMKSGGGIDNATAPASPGALTIKGNWSYWGQDSIFRTNDGDKWLPCRTMLVEVVRASNLSQVLGAGHTNSKGAFSINITNDGSAFYVLLWTFTYYGPGYELRVVDPSNTGISGLNGVYYWYAGPFTSGDGTFNMGARAPDPTYSSYRACWLHQDLWRADDFLYKNGLDAYQATIAWAPTVAAGTYYTHGGQIHIAAGKEHASHVVIHEYGHNYMYREYGNYFPPFDCPTHWVENCYDNGCGWTEGWANFFCIAVNNDPVYRDPGFFFDFEPGDWDTPGYCDGPTCEGRVAGALWDIFDSNPDGIDLSAYSWGYKNISNVFVNANQNIFADFWNQWRSYGYSNDAAHCLWQNTIDPGINLRPNAPTKPSGPTSGFTETSYSFATSATDPRYDNIKFYFDWGDSTYTTTGLGASGAIQIASHIWTSAGTKSIRAYTIDQCGNRSWEWSPIALIAITEAPRLARIGLFRPSTRMWYLDYDNNGQSDFRVTWGDSTDISVAGDWDGDDKDEIGLFRPSTRMWYLDYDNNGQSDFRVAWGDSTDIPVTGDWDGDGKDEIGLFRPSTRMWYLDYDNNGQSDFRVTWGDSTDIPVTGDWDEDGKDEIGLFRPSTRMWYLDNDNNGQSDFRVTWGDSTDIPVTGDWDGDSKDEIGLFRPSTARWYLDYDNNGASNYQVTWGASTDKPITGYWN